MATGGGLSRRERMVRHLVSQGICDERVLDALRRVPRERFVDEALRGEAYEDRALPIGENQTISQPWIVARMCELLRPDGTGKVLEIGSGSGYHAAVLSSLFELVYSVERVPELSRRARERIRELRIENVHFKIFDGSYGWTEFAPYRAIVVTAAVPEVPPSLLEQLDPDGVLVAPVAAEATSVANQTLMRWTRAGDAFRQDGHGACRFVPLVGRFGWSA